MNILFIEDNATNRVVVKSIFSTAGIDLFEAEDGFVGLEMIERNAYDLVLVDLRLPRMDGLTVIRKIRERHDEKGRVPVVVVTADTGADLRRSCLDVGADEFITKPIEVEQLFSAIARAVFSRQATPEF